MKETVIRPPRGIGIDLREIIDRIDLLWTFAQRDIKIRYRRTLIGFGWAVLQPFTQMVIFSLVFGKFAKIDTGEIPYPVFVYSALVPWQLFSRALSDASMSVASNTHMISKIYFPRIILPFSVIISAIVDFLCAFSVLIILMIIWSVKVKINILFFPIFLVAEIICALGVALWLAGVNVKFRDVKYTLPFLNQIWLFATPVIYPTKIIPEKWQILFSFNPMTGIIEGWRWCLIGSPIHNLKAFFISMIFMMIIFFGGLIYFHKVEKEFADIM